MGNAYVTGYTAASAFPVAGAAFAGLQGSQDGFIAKINPTGTALIYSTYIGGSNADYLSGIAVDSTDVVWAVGSTLSTDFPSSIPIKTPLEETDMAPRSWCKLTPSGALASFDAARRTVR